MFDKRVLLSFGFCLVCVLAISACDRGSLANLAAPTSSGDSLSSADSVDGGAGISEARKNAARLIVPGSPFVVDLLQRNPTDQTQHPCYPLGDATLGYNAWPSRLHTTPGVGIPLVSNFAKSEYDFLATKGDTQYVLSVRVPYPGTDPHFSLVEFNFRAVNPYEFFHTGHPWNPHYYVHEADYPSNDATVANRSLVDLTGSDVAIVVRGLNFGLPVAPTTKTTAWMNYLGTTGWVAFMRDDAYQSGRFYSILGGITGAPRALTDTPDPTDDGFFQSVQVRGDMFDFLSETPSRMTTPALPRCHVCPDVPPPPDAPTRPYALREFSNYDQTGAPLPGRGGFVFVMRSGAFSPTVVIDPSANPGFAPNPGNLILAPASGYAESALVTAGKINHPGAVDGPAGPAGVHEFSIAVFFIHTWVQGPCETEPDAPVPAY